MNIKEKWGGMGKQAKVWIEVIIGIIIVLVVLVVLFIIKGRSVDDRTLLLNEQPEEKVESTLTQNDAVPTAAVVQKTQPTAVPTALPYKEAVEKYADRRMQFNDVCQAFPYVMTVKNNTEVMIDNRSSKDRTITVGDTFVVSAGSYKVITLSSATLSTTVYVSCDAVANAGSIILQK